jgi:D-arabinose 1-dehydrogenase-like Zn-dependent alcohol dehydrogenase
MTAPTMTAPTMRVMVLGRSPGERRLAELPRPEPGQLLVKVRARGVCR